MLAILKILRAREVLEQDLGELILDVILDPEDPRRSLSNGEF